MLADIIGTLMILALMATGIILFFKYSDNSDGFGDGPE